MTKTTRYCDECGEVQGETNHWFLVDSIVHDGWREVRIITDVCDGVEMQGADACGEECAMKLASKLIRGEVEVAA